ncbi:Serine protease 29 [Sarcoptes scabiei]|uniref:Serine protease 29 n=1 Tax=Sarcoptes scabiei TaxID=52283 RepID=A0A834RDE9_SARSC|nr:Serine protease 29 [Sarcoptes scabiei]
MDLLQLIFLSILIVKSWFVISISLPEICGRNRFGVDFNRFIVGGNLSPRGQWPWQVFLRIHIHGDIVSAHIDCGGSILNDRWILTAAHCVKSIRDRLNDPNIKAEIKLNSIDIDHQDKFVITKRIIKIRIHEEFDSSIPLNDIALLKIEGRLDFSNGIIAPICLQNLAKENLFRNCYVTGYGFNDKDRSIDDYRLRSVYQNIADYGLCLENFQNFNSSSNLCIGGLGDHGSCIGDSGGPLQCYDIEEDIWYQTVDC